MSRLGIANGQITPLLRAGTYPVAVSLQVITNGAIVWFSDEQTELTLGPTGQPLGGWFLISDPRPHQLKNYSRDLYGLVIGLDAQIELVVNTAPGTYQQPGTQGQAGVTDPNIYADTLYANEEQPRILPVDNPGLEVSPTVSVGDIIAGLLAFIGLGLFLLVCVPKSEAQTANAFPTKSIDLRPGLNVIESNFLLSASGSNFIAWSFTEPAGTQYVTIILANTDTGPSGAVKLSFGPSIITLFGNPLQLHNFGGLQNTPTCQLSTIGNAVTGNPVLNFATALSETCKASTSGTDLMTLQSTSPFKLTIILNVQTQGDELVDKAVASTVLQTCFNSASIASGVFVSCSPNNLGINAITLPISGTTSLSNIIDTRGVKQLTLLGTCTQPVNINIGLYAEDGATVLFIGAFAITMGGPSSSIIFHMGSESGPGSNITMIAGYVGAIEFPQSALSFSFTNSTANAGTCTARLYLAY